MASRWRAATATRFPPAAEEEWISSDDNRVRSTLGEISEDGVDFRVGAHVQDLNLKSPREARSFNFYRIISLGIAGFTNQLAKVLPGIKFTDGIGIVRSQAQAAAP